MAWPPRTPWPNSRAPERGRGELVQPARDAGREQRTPHPRGVDLRISRREVPKGGPELGVAEHVLDRVRCRYQCSTAAARSPVDTSRLVTMNE